MVFVKIENGIVVQKQPYSGHGFVEAPDDVCCGQVLQEDGSFIDPPVDPEVQKEKRRKEIIAALGAVDQATIRPLRAGETERVLELEEKAQLLRDELISLE